MARLTKRQTKAHNEAMQLLELDQLTVEQCEQVYAQFHEGATHIQGEAGAFFTPLDLANDFCLEPCGRRIVDMCAGIGALTFALHHYKHKPQWQWGDGSAKPFPFEYVCIEINPAYVEIGRKLCPFATWICADVLDPATWAELGEFDCAMANPPWGRNNRTGGGFDGATTLPDTEFKVIEQASRVADYGAFLIPQMSAPFRFSGQAHNNHVNDGKAAKFYDQTGIEMQAGTGVDTAFHADAWKQPVPISEIVTCDFEELRQTQPALPPIQPVADATRAGLQAVIPGCEQHQKPGASQLELLF